MQGALSIMRCQKGFAALTTLAATLVNFAGISTEKDNAEDRRIKDKIRAVYALAQNIVIDGNSADWVDIPIIRSPEGDVGESSRDITGVRFAPLADRWLVMIATKAAAEKKPWSFYLEFNITGMHQYDIQIGLACNGPKVRIAGHFGKYRGELAGLKCATGDVVEIEIPLGSLQKVLPRLKEGLAANVRPFLVVMPFSFDNETNAGVDRAYANASYVLSANPGEIAGNIPKPPENAYAIDSPFRDQWFVTRGAWVGEHAWAYDISLKDARYRRTIGEGKRSDEYLAWGKEVYSPVKGVVHRIQSGTPDNPEAGKYPKDFALNNGTWIIAGDAEIILVHMMQHSVAVTAKQGVSVGDLLGKTGSSGRSLAPHIHLQTNWAAKKESRPTAIRNVVVGINAGSDDPWARSLDQWNITEGFFFRPR